MKNSEHEYEVAVGKRMSGAELVAYWRKRSAQVADLPERSLSRKEIGQIAMLRRRLGEETFGVVRFVLRDWKHFADMARQIDKVDGGPHRPHIGFLLAHHGVALGLYWYARGIEPPSTAKGDQGAA